MRRSELDEVPEVLSDGVWLTERWRNLILQKDQNNTCLWRRNYLELAVFTLVMESLNAGDVCIESGDQYCDYRSKLISWEEYHQAIAQYSEQVGLPSKPDEFVEQLKQTLEQAATDADHSFPSCEQVRFDNGRLVLSKPESKTKKAKLVELQRRLDDKMPTLSILDLLVESEKWLDLHEMFGPPSGEKSRLSDPRKRFIATLFCYGCNLGPSQVARSVRGLSRKQVAWLNIGYISEPALGTGWCNR